jgi:hypothetical protein
MPSIIKSVRKAAKSGFSKFQEIKRCDDLRARCKAFCKKESLTQPQLAEKMGVSSKQMSSFMTGNSLTQGLAYAAGMKFLKLKMPLSAVPDEIRNKVHNNKWGWSIA